MRVLKVAGLALMVLMLGVIWQRRVWITSAYSADTEQIDFGARGIDLSFEPVVLESTSFELQLAPSASGVALAKFGSSTRNDDVSIWGGSASFTGTVYGPEGPVAGATVVLERFVESNRVEVRVQADEFGAWTVTGAIGGVYRVRAFSPNTLISPPSEVMFVGEGAATVLTTTLQPHVPSISLGFRGGVQTNPGQDQTVAVVASTTIVDGEGRIVVVPIANTSVTAVVAGAGTLVSGNLVVTDSGGAARFRIRCDVPGTITVSGIGESISVSTALPACVPVPLPEPVPEPAAGDEATTGEESP